MAGCAPRLPNRARKPLNRRVTHRLNPPLLTLTTDFGLQDPFVGIMKGVILAGCPGACIVDLTHTLPPGDVRAGAFALLTAHRFFRPGTVHVAVVDPGVGSGRPALAARTPDAFYLGPDNGLLSWVLNRVKPVEVRRLENARLWLQPVSATFHGRDVFAPVAAHLARGGRFDVLGPRVADWIRLPWPTPEQTPAGWRGEVVYVDRFGNAITNLPASAASDPRPGAWVQLPGRRRVPLGAFYQAVPPGRPVAVPGSSGFLEIAINGGDAARALKLRVGSPVTLRTPRG